MELVHKYEIENLSNGTYKVEIYKTGDKYTLFIDGCFRAKYVSKNRQDAIESLEDFINRNINTKK